MNKDLQCPVCGQDAEGRRAVKRVKKWLQDSRLDRFMFDKLMTLIKAKMYGGEGSAEKERLMQQAMAGGTFKWNALDPDKPEEEERSPKTARRWAKEKLAREGEALRKQIKHDLWGELPPPAPGFKEQSASGQVQPVTLTPKAQKLRDKALKQRRKLKPEGDGEDADWALNYAEKKNEKLAKDRAYQREYYHKNKERIDRLRKARAERRVGARRSSNTGAKANGH